MIEQAELTRIYCTRPNAFAWFLGAGASASAGLPTAFDIIWDLKKTYYCREQNQDVRIQDMQNDATKARIQSFVQSRGFPAIGDHDEYSGCFEMNFGSDLEAQRVYIKSILSESKVRLSVGSRILAAMIELGYCRTLFTTNFDSVMETAFAKVCGKSLAAYHLEGSSSALNALNNEEYPLFVKLHGDFRYISLKNLDSDLADQDSNLAECLLHTGSRFGFVITGYSGRDKSIRELFLNVLNQSNPFPHGLFWTYIRGDRLPQSVRTLLDQARNAGVNAHCVPIESYDSMMTRIWRNIPDRPSKLDNKIKSAPSRETCIPLPAPGKGRALIRINAIPIQSLPRYCLELQFKRQPAPEDLRRALGESQHHLVLTNSIPVLCWGSIALVKQAFGSDLENIREYELPGDFDAPNTRSLKGFIEDALAKALIRGKPLITRKVRDSRFLIVDSLADNQSLLAPLHNGLGTVSGDVKDCFTVPIDGYPIPEQVKWAEAAKISIVTKASRVWLLLDPCVWISPTRSREQAISFLEGRTKDRYNRKLNVLLDAWIQIMLGTPERKVEIEVSAFPSGSRSENPSFKIWSRTGYSRYMSS